MATDIRDKIAKLLALSESPNENEAKAALLRARELMAKYKLRPEEIKKAENVTVIRELTNVTCTAMTNPWAVTLSAVIAEHYCCRAYRNRSPGCKVNRIGIVGLEDDFDICKRIFLYACECVIAACKHQIEKLPGDPPGTYREKCNAFGWGFVRGLKAAYAEQTAEHQEWGLVMVVPKEVDEKMADMGKPSAFGREKTGGTIDAYRAKGFAAGRDFNPGTRLTGGAERVALRG